MDTRKLGAVAAELMEYIEKREDETTEIGEVMILVELRGTHDDGSDQKWTTISTQCTDPRGWVQRGLLNEALLDAQQPEP